MLYDLGPKGCGFICTASYKNNNIKPFFQCKKLHAPPGTFNMILNPLKKYNNCYNTITTTLVNDWV